MEEAMKRSTPKRPFLRKINYDAPEKDISQKDTSENSRDAAPTRPRPLIRRVNQDETVARTGPGSAGASGPILKRVAKPGQVLTRKGPGGPSAGSRPEGSVLRRTASGRLQLRGKPPQAAQKVDKRRRRAPRPEDQEEVDQGALDKKMDDYISTYVDRPENPTEPVLFEPKDAKIDDLRSDWPNTPLSATGITESVVQKIEWIARRLPHGYQSPEQIAEHYLKGNLTRFESEEEKQLVLKIASEMSAKRKEEVQERPFPKHPRFRHVQDTSFTSLQGKESEKNFLLNTTVKGDYVDNTEQKFPFMQNVARMLGNNETYGSIQSQKLLARLQALIPQGRPAAQAKKA